jgi:hypothetical protein
VFEIVMQVELKATSLKMADIHAETRWM